MGKTSIEWTDRSANPIRARHKVTGKVGWHCVHHGPGCLHCYAETLNKRFGTKLAFLKPSADQVECFVEPRVLQALLKLRGGERVFICDMTDLFGDWVEDAWLDLIYAAMGLCRTTTFQVLTKRAGRMRSYLDSLTSERLGMAACELLGTPDALDLFEGEIPLPLANVWHGVSVEDRKHGLPRVNTLCLVPSPVRFLSVEPLLGDLGTLDLAGIHWVICGGESGPGARPMHVDWARSIRDQCVAAGVPFFFKQWGEWAPLPQPFCYTPAFGSGNREYVRELKRFASAHGASRLLDDRPEGWDQAMIRDGTCVLNGGLAIGLVGKKAAGRVLDGKVWDEFPVPLEATTP